MDDRFRLIAALAATQHSVVSRAQLCAHGVDASMQSKWERRGLMTRLGTRSLSLAGSPPRFERSLWAGLADLDGFGTVAGRAGGRLHGTRATRRQRQVDAQRHTELTLRGLRVLTFTYEDIRDRPAWVIRRLSEALAMTA